MIPKGTRVRVSTNNGGETAGILRRDYRGPWDSVLLEHAMFEISSYRIIDVQPVLRSDCDICGTHAKRCQMEREEDGKVFCIYTGKEVG